MEIVADINALQLISQHLNLVTKSHRRTGPVRVAPGTEYRRVEGNWRTSRTGPVSDIPHPNSLPLRFATIPSRYHSNHTLVAMRPKGQGRGVVHARVHAEPRRGERVAQGRTQHGGVARTHTTHLKRHPPSA
jgi:hypothetical protein